jgi:UDP-GlcNAc:undecaprenyl-phosphate/decaprenyl-phosphate GlcNAc-1-phosphate transferase
MRSPAESLGLLDHPGGRKPHAATVPLTVGLAMLLSFFLLYALFQVLSSGLYQGLLSGTLLLALIGFVDDLHGVSVRTGLTVEALVIAFINLWGYVQVAQLGDLLGLGDISLAYMAIPFSVFGVVYIINAINCLDGLDRLAGGVAVIALICFGVVALTGGKLSSLHLAVLLIGVVVGFLLFNLRTSWLTRASAFMGDCGSMFLGFILCWFAITLSHGDRPAIAPITAVWILGLPIIDAASLVLNRALCRHSPFVANRDHLHHMFMRRFSPVQTVWVLLAAGAALGCVGLVGHWLAIAESVMFLCFVGLLVVYTTVIRHYWTKRYQNWLRTGHERRGQSRHLMHPWTHCA